MTLDAEEHLLRAVAPDSADVHAFFGSCSTETRDRHMPAARVRYSSIEYPNFDIHVRSLWDGQQYSDDDGAARVLGISSATWPRFGTLWPSGRVLAALMAHQPIDGLRVLEVGCGLALPSLVLNARGADITATDHHPSVQTFLNINTDLNNQPRISFVRCAWAEEPAELDSFDLVVGADLLYDHGQIEGLAGFLRRRCRVGGQALLVGPGRKLRRKFGQFMEARHFAPRHRRADPSELRGDAEKAHILTWRRMR